MENILKLTVKKEIYNDLLCGKLSYIYYEPTQYWIKRLAKNPKATFDELENEDDFKSFDSVSVSCGGETATYRFMYITKGVSHADGELGLCISIEKFGSENVEPIAETTETVEEDIEESIAETIETTETVEEDIEVKPTDEPIAETTETVEEDTKEDNTSDTSFYNTSATLMDNINDMIDIIGTFENVVVVGVPSVIISSNGHIFGTKQYIPKMRNEAEIRIPIGTFHILYDVDNDGDFLIKISRVIEELGRDNFLFIWKKGCKMIKDKNGRKYLRLRITAKRNY